MELNEKTNRPEQGIRAVLVAKKYAEELQQIAEVLGMPLAPFRSIIAKVRELKELSACESPPIGDAPCESRWNWNFAQSTTHTPDTTELRKDLLTALQWINDGDDQEGRDLIVDPMMAKHSMHNISKSPQ